MSTYLEKNKEDIYSYSYGRYISNGVLVIATAAILGGIFIALWGLESSIFITLLGVLLILVGIISFIPSELFQVNFKTREYRTAVYFFGYNKGVWKNLGTIKYISIVTNTTRITTGNPASVTYGKPMANLDAKVNNCKLRFFKRVGYYIEIDDFNRMKSAIKVGKALAKGLDLKLLNATAKPSVFIDL